MYILKLENTITHQLFQYSCDDINNGEKLYYKFNINTLELDDGEYKLTLLNDKNKIEAEDILKIGDFNPSTLQYKSGDNTYIAIDLDAKLGAKNAVISSVESAVYPDDGYDGMTVVNVNAQGVYDSGYDVGNLEGYNSGYTNGKGDGLAEGYDNGYDEGKTDGYQEGLELGYQNGFNNGILEQKNLLTSISITENGSYTREDGWNEITVEVPDLNGDYEEGYQEGLELGYQNGFNNGVLEQKDQLIGIEITENGTYTRENGYNEVIVNVPDTNGSYDEGYEDGIAEGTADAGAIIAETARTLNITENGTYTSQYTKLDDLDLPEYGIGGYFDVETPFFEYAKTKRQYYTDITPTLSSKIEFWFIDNDYSLNDYNYDHTNIVSALYDGSLPRWGFEKTDTTYSGYNYEAIIGNDSIRVKTEKIKPNVFNHIVMSVAEGLWVNGEKIGDFNTTSLPKLGNVVIGKTNELFTFGMVKVDDNIYIPSADGFIKYSTGVLLTTYDFSKSYTYEKYYDLPTFDGNLIRTVKVNVPPKINLQQTGLKLGYSTFTEVPEWVDWDGITDINYMFYSCSSLTTIPQLDTSKVTDMNNMFYYCKNLTTIPLLNTSKVTNMKYMFYSCSSLTTIPQLDTSKVTDMNNMFYSCSKLVTVPQIDTSKVTNMYYMFANCTKLESIPPLYAGNLTYSLTNYGIFGSSEMTALTDFGGLIDLKYRMNGNYSFQKCPNLTYQSCINILNGLYDFTGNGETPTSSQGILKVHSNFLTLVGDEISIGINKGWVISQ